LGAPKNAPVSFSGGFISTFLPVTVEAVDEIAQRANAHKANAAQLLALSQANAADFP
jgi:hypothetical protein